MNDATAAVRRHVDICNQADADARAGSIARAWVDDAPVARP